LPPAGIDEFAIYEEIPNGDIGKFASLLKENLKKDFRKHFALFKDDGFIEKLEKWSGYERQKTIVATDYEDEVNSEVFFRTTDGDNLKPDDYIEAFVKYVQENENKINALEIVMKKPKNLQLNDLKELAKILRRQPQAYSVEKLNKALELSSKEKLHQHSNKVLDQISELISYIQYAEDTDEFISMQERVDKAVIKIIANEKFSIEQIKWFNVIRDFVITRLKITKEDINSSSVFRKVGGYKTLNEVFNGKLDRLMTALNEAILV
jgi:type I restriction enzyme R subunit